MGDGSFGRPRAEALFVIGRRGDYATTRKNVRKLTRVDDAEVGNSRLTLLRLMKDVRIMGEN